MSRLFLRVVKALVLASACFLSACGGDDPYGMGSATRPGFDAAARQELLDLGLGKYLGAFAPDRAVWSGSNALFEFKADTTRMGPICYTGKPFEVSVRDTGSRNLLIYLQGGGACWSALCSASEVGGVAVPSIGWSGPIEGNPLRNYNVVYIGYCDGSVFSGDNDFPDPEHGDPDDGIRHHHGLANLSAGIDIARSLYPDPDKLVLAGFSAGGYGTLIGTEVVRLAYPHTPLYVINDAGLGLATPDIIQAAKTEWKFEQFIPPSCKACSAGNEGQLTPIIGWALDHDPSLRVGAFSSYHDFVIGGVFLQMQTDAFKTLLLKQTGAIHDQFPHRFERFLMAGSMHTAVIGYPNLEIDDVSLGEWTSRMVDNRYDWPDLLAKDK